MHFQESGIGGKGSVVAQSSVALGAEMYHVSTRLVTFQPGPGRLSITIRSCRVSADSTSSCRTSPRAYKTRLLSCMGSEMKQSMLLSRFPQRGSFDQIPKRYSSLARPCTCASSAVCLTTGTGMHMHNIFSPHTCTPPHPIAQV